LTRSVTTPAGSDSARIGREPIVLTRPTMKALLDSCSANQPWAIVCIQVPIRESVWPIQKILKFRWARSVRNGFRDRAVIGIPLIILL
jgi:hypothetical protein